MLPDFFYYSIISKTLALFLVELSILSFISVVVSLRPGRLFLLDETSEIAF
jgi:hypothetical protein